MTSLLNRARPPAFCPGCSHERVVRVLDAALQGLGLRGDQVVLVTDIGCCGLFDTFFHTHALHGLHGRALTYATGLKLARPELTVIVIMGDGGLGIGGAHVLSSCRRNLDLTLLVLNNFNYGMTGGQCSATTPAGARTSSGFLGELEAPLDICRVGSAAGAAWVGRDLAAGRELQLKIEQALTFPGFALLDIWGLCPGRYGKSNRISRRDLEEELARRPQTSGPVPANSRPEYGAHYRRRGAELPATGPEPVVERRFEPPFSGRYDVLLLGAAGQRIATAGEVCSLAAMTAGLHATQKNDYPITVMRGHSVSEIVLSSAPIGYTGMERPRVVVALAPEGVARRSGLFCRLDPDCLVITAAGLILPETAARTITVDFAAAGINADSRALAALGVLARHGSVLTAEMLRAALAHRFKAGQLADSLSLLARGLTAFQPAAGA